MANGDPPERHDNEPEATPHEAPAPRAAAGGGANIPQAPAPAREDRPPVQFDPYAPITPVQRHEPERIRHGFRLRYLVLIAAALAGGYYLFDKLQRDAFLTAAGTGAHEKTKAMENAAADNQLSLYGNVERRGNELFITLGEAHRPADQGGLYYPISLSIKRYYNNGRLLSAEVVATVDRGKIGAAPLLYHFRGENSISVDVMQGTGSQQWDATGTLIRE